MTRPAYNQQKATEAVAYFLNKRSDKSDYHLMVIKLLYLAERKAIQQWGRSITWDHFVSMDNGPVTSVTYNLICGTYVEDSSIWEQQISSRSDHKIKLKGKPALNKISQAEKRLLDEVFREHGHKDRFELANETHSLPEWNDPRGSMIPIQYETLLELAGLSQPEIEEIQEEWAATAFSKNLLAIN